MSSTKLAIRHFQTYCFFDVLLLCLKFPIEMMPDVVFQILHYLQGWAICNKNNCKIEAWTNKQAQAFSDIHSFYINYNRNL